MLKAKECIRQQALPDELKDVFEVRLLGHSRIDASSSEQLIFVSHTLPDAGTTAGSPTAAPHVSGGAKYQELHHEHIHEHDIPVPQSIGRPRKPSDLKGAPVSASAFSMS